MKKMFFILFSIILLSDVYSQFLNVATYNLRLDNKGDSVQGNGWIHRKQAVIDLIKYNDFDIFGSQEVLHNQLIDLSKGLSEYAYLGVGRDDGKTQGEYSPVFYKKTKFKLLKSGYFWLSENPDAPSFGWDAACRRICTYGEFEDIKSGFKFWFFTTHFDHIGVEARRNSAKLILHKIKELCEKRPIILTGDFNIDQKNESYLLLANSGILQDSYIKSPVRLEPNGTFNGWEINQHSEERIDHIFVSKEFKVERYGILTNLYWRENDKTARFPSDHFPVKVVISY